MKLAALSIIFFIANVAQTFHPATDDNSQHEQEIRTAIEAFAQAFVKADTVVLESLLADDYVHSNANGDVLDKTRWLTFAKNRHEDLKSGKVRIDTYRNDDIRVRVYGNTAVVTGQNTSLGFRDGKEWKINLRFTNVWVKREGRWQRVAFHDSNVEQP